MALRSHGAIATKEVPMPRPFRLRRAAASTVAALAALGGLVFTTVMIVAAPANATVFNKAHFSFEESLEEDLCGIAVRIDSIGSGHFRNRTGKGELDQAFFGQSSFEFTDTFTNLATGTSFSIGGHLTGMDVKATPLGGNVFEFKFRESGTVVVRDMDGNVVLREAGAIWITVVFDTLGDSMPGGEVLDETVDRVSGPHPLLDMDEAAFCDIVHDLIG
jgi:hypothetical protein